MCILAVVSVFIAVAINSTSGTARLSARARNYVNVEKATEGAIEHGLAFGRRAPWQRTGRLPRQKQMPPWVHRLSPV